MSVRPQILLALLCLFVIAPAVAAGASAPSSETAVTLTARGGESMPLGDRVYWVKDSQRTLNSQALLASGLQLPEGMEWTRNESKTPNLGFSEAPFWFAFSVRNASDVHKSELLEIAYPILDYVDVHLINGSGEVRSVYTGDLRPVSSRPIEHRNFLFPIEVAAKDSVTVLIRVQTEGAVQLPVTLWQEAAFFENDQKFQALQFIFAGIMLAIALYNLLIWLFVRISSYLWYILNVLTIALVQLSLHGMTALYLWPDLPELNNHSLVGFITLNMVFVCLFTYGFLNLSQRGRFIRAFVAGFGVYGALVFALSWFLSYGVSIRLAVLGITVGAPVVWMIGIYLSIRGDILARFYTIAWTILLMGHFFLAFNKLGILPRTVFFEYGPQMGAALEVILLSFALAYRINLERQRRFQAQQSLLEAERENREIQRQANELLEHKVRERTRELEAANLQLRKMSSLDGLTGIHNRRYFDETLQKEWSKGSREPSHICLLLIDVDHFKGFNDDHGHLCGDACLQHLAGLLQRSVYRAGDFVARFGGEEFAVLLCHTELEGGAIVAERIRRQVESQPLDWEGQSMPITVSIGVAGTEPMARGIPNSLIASADEALYTAKESGRNCVMTCQPVGADCAPTIEPLSRETLAKV
ncbi:diguanylate cyclase [Marinobacter salinisoli]|uniref:diguanylate cyclase n=1 Tax=Marinobacter salinisoli TaxID=2769486 RepID=A0ABX7MQ43_9GAMM|nr:diguanylate cyclase [Marinobacter salinisoli]QSP94426.1 diguanylate cyclase [Marinobacter salinisoli]